MGAKMCLKSIFFISHAVLFKAASHPSNHSLHLSPQCCGQHVLNPVSFGEIMLQMYYWHSLKWNMSESSRVVWLFDSLFCNLEGQIRLYFDHNSSPVKAFMSKTIYLFLSYQKLIKKKVLKDFSLWTKPCQFHLLFIVPACIPAATCGH